MPLAPLTTDLGELRALAQELADEWGTAALVVPQCHPKETWQYKLAYIVREDQATTWERDEAVARLKPMKE